MYAGTLSAQAGEVLNQRIEMRQREQGYRDGLESLGRLDAVESPENFETK